MYIDGRRSWNNTNDWIIHINTIREGMEICPCYSRQEEYLREKRNELLKATDCYLLPNIVVIDESKLNFT